LSLANAFSVFNLQIIAMATAAVLPMLPEQLSGQLGLAGLVSQAQEPSREEVFAPYCGKWIKVRGLLRTCNCYSGMGLRALQAVRTRAEVWA
jgi:hypothetical protein